MERIENFYIVERLFLHLNVLPHLKQTWKKGIKVKVLENLSHLRKINCSRGKNGYTSKSWLKYFKLQRLIKGKIIVCVPKMEHSSKVTSTAKHGGTHL